MAQHFENRLAKPYWHIHIDGKKGPNEPFVQFATSLGFKEFPFQPGGDQVPVVHLSKKYGRLEAVRYDFEQLTQSAPHLQYSGYIEVEQIERRYSWRNPDARAQDTPVAIPFQYSRRPVCTPHGETFKHADMHYTISDNTDPQVVLALRQSGLLYIEPVDEPTIIFTGQAPEQNQDLIDDLEQRMLDFTQEHGSRIPAAVLKIESILDSYCSPDIGPESLPILIDMCIYAQ